MSVMQSIVEIVVVIIGQFQWEWILKACELWIKNSSWSPFAIVRNYGYLKNRITNSKELERKFQELRQLIDKANRTALLGGHVDGTWRTDAVMMGKAVKSTLENSAANLITEDRRYFGCGLNVFGQINIGRDIAERIEQIDKLIQDYRTFPTTAPVSPTKLIGERARVVVENILECIIFRKKRIIGVHGMMGVGKTAIMTEISNHILTYIADTSFEGSECFDSVLWVNLSGESDLANLQTAIAEKIFLDLPGDDRLVRREFADRLVEREFGDLLKIAAESGDLSEEFEDKGMERTIWSGNTRPEKELDDLLVERATILRANMLKFIRFRDNLLKKEFDNQLVERATRLRDTLLKKKFLLILDDMWTPFSLEQIGIPEPTKENGCKLIIISRSFSLCNWMNTDINFEVELLNDEEAWVLFTQEIGAYSRRSKKNKKKAGPHTFLPEEIQTIMKEVAKECGGLPLTIKTVARALRKLITPKYSHTSKNSWERALTGLKESGADLEFMQRMGFTDLNFGFERLNESAKSCFLYCALFPKHHHFETKELMENWIWEGLLGEVGSIEDKMREAADLLDELIDVHLLESTDQRGGIEQIKMRDQKGGIKHIKMHALIRDMAIKITQKKPEFLNPLEYSWPKQFETASVCPKLSTLLWHYSSLDVKLYDGFFHGMQIRVLDLSSIGVRILPKSLCSLYNLHALFLRHCPNLSTLPSPFEFERLMVLELFGTPMEVLPPQARLPKLKRLDLSVTSLREFPLGFLYAMQNLQELLMGGRSIVWKSRLIFPDPEREDINSLPHSNSDSNFLDQYIVAERDIVPYSKRGMEAGIEDLISLRYLVILELNFIDTEVFVQYVNSGHWCQLKGFKFCVGELYRGKLEKNSMGFICEFDGNRKPTLLPKDTSELRVLNCNDITGLTIPSCLENLKIVSVSSCTGLNYLFKRGMLDHLPNLEEISIKHCPNMEVIIEKKKEEEEDSTPDSFYLELPKLQKLVLHNLPKLWTFCNGRTVTCMSLRTISVRKCQMLRKFPCSASFDYAGDPDDPFYLSDSDDADVPKIILSPPVCLQEVRGEKAWLEQLQWQDLDTKTKIESIFIEEYATDDELPPRMSAPVRSSSNSTARLSEITGSTVTVPTKTETDISSGTPGGEASSSGITEERVVLESE